MDADVVVVGGRVWSGPSARGSVATELGAEFIHGRAKETMALLRDIGTAAVDTSGESWACYESGDRFCERAAREAATSLGTKA